METYHSVDPHFVDKFLASIYVDDLVTGSTDINSAFEFYKKSRQRLAVTGLRLRRFITNYEELQCLIQQNESQSENGGAIQPQSETASRDEEVVTYGEEDISYAKSSFGVENDEQLGLHKILGIQWNITRDEFQFDVRGVAVVMGGSEPTKRSVVGATVKFFDPLGVVSPVTVLLKMFAQQLCEARVGWDEPLKGDLLKQWEYLLTMLRDAEIIVVPQLLCPSTVCSMKSARLIGFCDASSKAYAAVVYFRLETEAHQVSVKFVAAKTQVAPVGGATIPQLELLSGLVLSKLIDNVHTALGAELQLDDPVCFSDSKVALFWIQGTNHE